MSQRLPSRARLREIECALEGAGNSRDSTAPRVAPMFGIAGA
jgi:hypothetical protein